MVSAEDHEGSKRRSGQQAERTNGRRKPNRVGNASDIRSGRSPHRLGLKRSNPRGSRRGQFSQALRSGQHHAPELPSIYPRVDLERTKDKRNVTVICRHRNTKGDSSMASLSKIIDVHSHIITNLRSQTRMDTLPTWPLQHS